MSGGNKNPNLKRGRGGRPSKDLPPGPSSKTVRRGTFARIARDSGLADEVILGAISPRIRSDARKTLNRYVQAVGPAAASPARDGKLRQAAFYAVQDLARSADRLTIAWRSAGIRVTPKVGENLKSQRAVAKRDPDAAITWINCEIDYLERLETAVRAQRAAGVHTLPESFQHPETINPEIERRITVLHAELDEVERERDEPLRQALSALRAWVD